MHILIYLTQSALLAYYLPLTRMLRQHNWHVDICDSEQECLTLLASNSYTALACVLPREESPFLGSLTEKIKVGHENVLFGVITNRESYAERALWLGRSLDFYYIFPFSYTQLLSDLVLLSFKKEKAHSSLIQTSHFSLNILTREVYFDQVKIHLTRIQFNLLCFFLKRQGLVVTRAQIWEGVWGFDDYPLANTIDVHINRLRRKLRDDEGRVIRTIYGVGYQMAGGY